ncbi:DNA, complete sequence [Bacillus sp. GeD10]|nr:DNA, complete sequence [Bacillus sp. GeD10]
MEIPKGGWKERRGRGILRWYSKTGTQYRDKLFYIRGVSDEKTV